MSNQNKLWIKTPYPEEKWGEGVWVECTTPYEKRMWNKHNKKKLLPTRQQPDKPKWNQK